MQTAAQAALHCNDAAPPDEASCKIQHGVWSVTPGVHVQDGTGDRVTGKVDVFSFGVVMWVSHWPLLGCISSPKPGTLVNLILADLHPQSHSAVNVQAVLLLIC